MREGLGGPEKVEHRGGTNWKQVVEIGSELRKTHPEKAEQIARIVSNLVHAPHIDEAAIYAVCGMTIKEAEYHRRFDHNDSIAMRLKACGCEVDERDKIILSTYNTRRVKGIEKIFLKVFRPKDAAMANDVKIQEEFVSHECEPATIEQLLEMGKVLRFLKRKDFQVVALGTIIPYGDSLYAAYLMRYMFKFRFGLTPIEKVAIAANYQLLGVRRPNREKFEKSIPQQALF